MSTLDPFLDADLLRVLDDATELVGTLLLFLLPLSDFDGDPFWSLDLLFIWFFLPRFGILK